MKKSALFLLTVCVLLLSACNKEPIRVACVGDSITFGHGIADRDHDTYPAILDSLLGSKFNVQNFGVSGTTALKKSNMPYMNEQAYKDALAFNPDIVTIKLGTNDSKPYNWENKANFKDDLKFMINSFRELPANPDIWLCLPVPAYGNAWNINDSIIFNEVIPLIREVAKEEGVEVVDLNTPMSNQRKFFPDTIHPNEEGQEKIASILYEEIFTNYL